MNFEYSNDLLDEINVFTLKGDLIEKTQAMPMMYEIERLIAKKDNKFILKLHDLKYMNSTGLNILINILTRSRKGGGDVALIGVTPKVAQLLAITKLDTIFNITDTIEEAQSKLNK